MLIGTSQVSRENRDKFGRRLTVYNSPINPKMGEGRWQDALRRMRKSIENNSLDLDDCTDLGNHHTSCSWGMCSNDIEQWPDKDDHVFPEEFTEYERIAVRDFPGKCPLDKKAKPDYTVGCFYRCLLFGGKLRENNRVEVLALYDKVISERERKYGCKTTADDREPWRKE